MSVLNVIDGASASRFTKVTGTGDSGDPFVPSVNVEVVIPGTNATDLGKAEDAPHVSGDTGVLVLAVRNDAGSTLAGTTGDYIPLGTDSSGNLRVTSGGGGLSANVAGDVAHDAVDSGDPVKVGGYAKATAPTAVSADGDRVNAWFDLAGRLAIHDGAGNLSIDDGGNVISIDDAGGSLTVDGSVTVSGTVTANAGSGTMTVDSELPSAAALADTESNPTAPAVGSHLLAWNGASWDRVRVASKGYDMSAVAITTIATVATPTSGKKWRLMSGTFSVSAACSVLFEDNAGGTTVFRTPKLLADTPYSFDLGGGYLSAVANNVLKATASTGTVSITGTLRVTEE